MTAFTDEAVKTHQREVQQLLGRCMLKLQQYERLIKALVAGHEISGTVYSLKSNIDNRTSRYAKKTLGYLVDELLGSYVISDKTDAPPEPKDSALDAPTSIYIKFQVEIADADYAKIERDLRAFVSTRNALVHHFIDLHDLWSVAGCIEAKNALSLACSRIDQHFKQLKVWGESIEGMRKSMAGFYKTDMFIDHVFNGIQPDGTVVWAGAGIVRVLLEAATALAVDGWASIDGAGEWVAKRYPEQMPAKYGCVSWRQVLHESRQFDFKKLDANCARATYFREKECPAN